jgi:hypothetical protein
VCTFVNPVAQRKVAIHAPAARTGLRRCEPTIGLNELASIPGRLVPQEPIELSNTGISQSPCQWAVPEQASEIQVFDRQPDKRRRETFRQFISGVAPLERDTSVESCEPTPRLAATDGPWLGSRQGLVGSSHLPLRAL